MTISNAKQLGKCIEVKQNIRLFSILFESLAKDYEIPRKKLLLETIIGQGQFGDVHRGTYVSPVSIWHASPHTADTLHYGDILWLEHIYLIRRFSV